MFGKINTGLSKMNDIKWSKKEKSIARAAFEKAYEKECNLIIEKLKVKSLKLSDSKDIWELHDYLSEIRKEIDEKYDYRYSVMIMVFAILLKQQWLKIDDIEGLSEDKIDKIKTLANI
jgi:glycyl-tRNA synthetase beta subunit